MNQKLKLGLRLQEISPSPTLIFNRPGKLNYLVLFSFERLQLATYPQVSCSIFMRTIPWQLVTTRSSWRAENERESGPQR